MQGDRPVGAPGRHETTVGAERHRVDGAFVAEQRQLVPPGGEIPILAVPSRLPVRERPVRAHGNAHDRAGVPPQRRELSAGLRIPDLRRPVPAGRDHLSVAPNARSWRSSVWPRKGSPRARGSRRPARHRVVLIAGRDQDRPSGLKPRAHAGKPESTLPSSLPEEASHSRRVLSQLLVARRRPSGLTATDVAAMECPVSFVTSFPVVTSQPGPSLPYRPPRYRQPPRVGSRRS